MAEEYQHTMKLLLIGDAGVGKSSILLRFTDNLFNAHQASTIGVYVWVHPWLAVAAPVPFM